MKLATDYNDEVIDNPDDDAILNAVIYTVENIAHLPGESVFLVPDPEDQDEEVLSVQAMFDKAPEKYLPAYGGWCAFGMSVEDKFPVDPTNFKIVDGRLHVFLKNKNVDARKLWNQGRAKELTAMADAHWSKVSGM